MKPIVKLLLMKNKTSLKFRLENFNKKGFYLISPDGFSIIQDDKFDNAKDALEAFEKWKSRYKSQGYYSSTYDGKIPLDQLEYYIDIDTVPYKLRK